MRLLALLPLLALVSLAACDGDRSSSTARDRDPDPQPVRVVPDQPAPTPALVPVKEAQAPAPEPALDVDMEAITDAKVRAVVLPAWRFAEVLRDFEDMSDSFHQFEARIQSLKTRLEQETLR